MSRDEVEQEEPWEVAGAGEPDVEAPGVPDGPTSVGEDFPRQQARCREVLALYKDLGSPGAFGALVIEDVLRRADVAMASDDIIQILRVYEEMRGVK